MPFLKENILSNFHNRLYGAAGSEVIIIADHDNVQIVEDKEGNRFPVATDKLSDVAVQVKPVLPIENYSGRGRKKTVPIIQKNLF